MSTVDALGTVPTGIATAGTPPPSGLLAAESGSVVDAVLLAEIEASDRVTAVVPEPWPATATEPTGIIPGSVIGGTVRIDVSDLDWTSQPDDTRPNTHFPGRLGEWSIERGIPLGLTSERRLAVAVAALSIMNADGAGDAYGGGLAVDGYPVRVSLLPRRSSAYSEARTLFAGIGRGWRTSGETLRLLARDQGYALDVLMPGLYGGTGGADGGAELVGQPIMEIYGIVRTVTPQLVDPARLIYRIHARRADALLAVYDSGAPVTAGIARAGYADLVANTPSPGFFDWSLSADGSFFRLGSSPSGSVFFDARGDAPGGAYTDTLAGMMRGILQRFGATLATGAFDSAELWAPAAAGIVIQEPITVSEAVSRIAAGGALYWGDDGAGLVTIGRLSPPSPSPGLLLDERVILGDVEEIEPPQLLWRIRAGYRRNWSTLTSTDLVAPPTITDARRQELTQPGRAVTVSAASRRAQYLLAEEATLNTLFDEEAPAQSLAQNMLDLYAPGRRVYRIPTGIAGYGAALGQTIRVVWPRLGLAAGRNLRVLGQVARGTRVDLLAVG
jgi:hypothetical protein